MYVRTVYADGACWGYDKQASNSSQLAETAKKKECVICACLDIIPKEEEEEEEVFVQKWYLKRLKIKHLENFYADFVKIKINIVILHWQQTRKKVIVSKFHKLKLILTLEFLGQSI